MGFSKLTNIYFLGIGGIGMSALARYFNAMGKSVSGYDRTRTPLTNALEEEGIVIHFDDDVKHLSKLGLTPGNTLVIYTPAVPVSHTEYVYLLANGFDIKKRSEVLGMITQSAFTIAVAGTHGKTTTSSLIAHILRSAGVDCSAFLGGITQNYNTNLFIGTDIGKPGAVTVVEADEYDRSFLFLHPDIAVITSIDADHLDIYGSQKDMHESYNKFAKQVKQEGTLIAKNGTDAVLDGVKARILRYSMLEKADAYISDFHPENGQYTYTIQYSGQTFSDLRLGLPGLHNMENSVAAVAVAKLMGVSEAKIREALSTFRGVKRRFEYQIKTDKLVYIDDYAHHPEELRACISSVRQLYPGRQITGIFQPHLFSRTRDFADEFAKSLSLLDELILLEIYPAREMPIEGITSSMLLEKVTIAKKMVCPKTELVAHLLKNKPDVLLTMGAGDIDNFVEPIKNALSNKN